MGQFSWIYADTNMQLMSNLRADTYLLVPPVFQDEYGKSIYEPYYDGYGNFGGYDVYDLIAEWNREYLSETMLRETPKLENYGGLSDFEKEELRNNGASEDEIAQNDLEQKEFYYNAAIKRRKTTIERINDYRNGLTSEEMVQKYGEDWKRSIGIDIACYDKQNENIPYPIKITTKEMDYDCVTPSKSDPNQGW